MYYRLVHLTTPSTGIYYHPAHPVITVKVHPTGFYAIASLQNNYDSPDPAQTLARSLHNSDRPHLPNLNRDVPSTSPENVDVLAHNGFSYQIARHIFLLLRIPTLQDRLSNCLLVAELNQNLSDLLHPLSANPLAARGTSLLSLSLIDAQSKIVDMVFRRSPTSPRDLRICPQLGMGHVTYVLASSRILP